MNKAVNINYFEKIILLKPPFNPIIAHSLCSEDVTVLFILSYFILTICILIYLKDNSSKFRGCCNYFKLKLKYKMIAQKKHK